MGCIQRVADVWAPDAYVNERGQRWAIPRKVKRRTVWHYIIDIYKTEEERGGEGRHVKRKRCSVSSASEGGRGRTTGSILGVDCVFNVCGETSWYRSQSFQRNLTIYFANLKSSVRCRGTEVTRLKACFNVSGWSVHFSSRDHVEAPNARQTLRNKLRILHLVLRHIHRNLHTTPLPSSKRCYE